MTPGDRIRTRQTMSFAPFKVEMESLKGGVGVFTVSGELDQASAEDLRKPLDDAIEGGTRAVMIDMSDCGFIDSTGLGIIVDAWKKLQQRNGDSVSLAICCPEPEVKRLLELTGLDQAIPIRESREEAIGILAN